MEYPYLFSGNWNRKTIMRKHVLFSIIFFCSGLFSSAVISEHHGENKYVIQIGAFHEVPEEIKNDARQYGELQQEKIADLIRLTVGPFRSRLDAEKRLVDIKNKYSDAFIRLETRAETIKSEHIHSDNHSEDHQHPHFDEKEMEKWQHLTEDQRAHVVYLDGELHLKYGDEFTRIE